MIFGPAFPWYVLPLGGDSDHAPSELGVAEVYGVGGVLCCLELHVAVAQTLVRGLILPYCYCYHFAYLLEELLDLLLRAPEMHVPHKHTSVIPVLFVYCLVHDGLHRAAICPLLLILAFILLLFLALCRYGHLIITIVIELGSGYLVETLLEVN